MGKQEKTLDIQSSIAVFRAQHKLTQQQLAESVEVTRATISAIEKGDYNPSLELAFKLARKFQVKIEDIFTAEEIKK